VREKHQVNRVLLIIEVLAEASDALGVSEIARRAGLPKSTAARILGDLVGMDLVLRTQSLYLPGPRLLRLADRFEPSGVSVRRRFLLPHLLRLREETGLAVAFATLRYRQVRFETVLPTTTQPDVLATVPLWAPTYCTASGKVLLAYAPGGERLIADDLAAVAYTRKTVTDIVLLSQEFDRIRRDGTASNKGEYIDNIHSIASPVFGRQDFAGALAVCGAPDDFNTRVAAAVLRRIASEATAAMRRHDDGVGRRPS
jgi:DNA-binding IclR family transcriptional regulator